jgi:CRISPR/Cas system-associated exonuclease Cas4 (RecB family)
MKTFIHHEFPKLERDTKPDGTRVYKTPSGKSYPSITTVTGLHSKASIIAWRKKVGEAEANRISNRAATRGTRIHTLCESYLRGESAEPDIFDQEVYRSLIPHLDKINNIHALEDPLYSDHLEVAGTVDCIAEYNGKLAVIDFKTSARVKTRDNIHGYFMQTSAYAVAFEERTGIPVGKLVIIMGVDDNEPLIFEEKRDDWIGEFKELRQQYRNWRNI